MAQQDQNFIIKDKKDFPSNGCEKKESPLNTKSTDKDKSEFPLPEVTFPTFIFSLNQSAMMNLGIIADPSTGKKGKSLTLAKQTIDILGLLEDKTKGNLTEYEENMLKNILYDLRIVYIKEKDNKG